MTYNFMTLYFEKARIKDLNMWKKATIKEKVLVMALFGVMLAFGIIMTKFDNNSYSGILNIAFAGLGFLLLFFIDKIDRKHIDLFFCKNMDNVKCLEGLLKDELGICSKEQLQELIELYELKLSEVEKKCKQKNSVYALFIPTVSSIITFVFKYNDLIGQGFRMILLYLIVFIVIFAIFFIIWEFVDRINSPRGKYNIMIEKLKFVKILF